MKTKKIKEFFKQLFFPKKLKCVVCKKELNFSSDYSICEKCLEKLPWNNGKRCAKCGNPLESLSDYCLSCKRTIPKFEKAVSPLVFKEDVTMLVHRFKYSNHRYLADVFSAIIYDEFRTTGWKIDLVYPIPLHKTREKERGFNQAELMCEDFVKNGYEVDKTNLVREKHTTTQTELSYNERAENLNGAFKVLDVDKIKGKNILLVDDVFTTGSTMNHCTDLLLKKGANKVYCLTLAHTYNFKPLKKEENE